MTASVQLGEKIVIVIGGKPPVVNTGIFIRGKLIFSSERI
jgi:hypothetical protein